MSTSEELIKFLKRHQYFSGLSRERLASAALFLQEKDYDKGELIIMEGETCKAMYFIKSGRVRILKTSPEGKEQVLRMMGDGESFNEVPIFDGGKNPASVETLMPSTLYILSKKDLLSLVQEYPDLALAILKNISLNLRHLVSLVEDLSFRHVASRVAKILLQYSHPGGSLFEPLPTGEGKLTQQQIASIVGTAREVVGRSLKTLEKEGAIKISRGRIEILDPKLLARKI